MSHRQTEIIEVIAFGVSCVLAVLWAWSQDGRYEPWTYICGATTIGLELYRRFVLKTEAAPGDPPKETEDSLLAWLRENVSAKPLSESLPKAVRLARMLGDAEFEKWARLELYGYTGENGMTETDVVPEYRTVPGLYYDIHRRPLIVQDPDVARINGHRFRFSARELEQYAQKKGTLYAIDEGMLNLVREHLEFPAVRFGFNPTAVLGVLEAIRSRLHERLRNIEHTGELRGQRPNPTPVEPPETRAQRFREERIAGIAQGDLPVELPPTPKVVLHLLPATMHGSPASTDLAAIAVRNIDFAPLSAFHLNGWGARHNLDGVLITGEAGDPSVPVSYLQVYRNGAVEAVDTTILRSQHEREAGLDPLIAASPFGRILIVGLRRYMLMLETLKVPPPVIVALSLVGVKGYRLCRPDRTLDYISRYQMDRDVLLLPTGILRAYDDHPDKLLQPAFDALWQCVGYPRDELYGEGGDGRWSDRTDGQPPVP